MEKIEQKAQQALEGLHELLLHTLLESMALGDIKRLDNQAQF